ncbi:transposase [Salmonella enterica]|nr:transposase [Salmonella enterica]
MTGRKSSVVLWAYTQVTDMRCSFNGQTAKVHNTLRTDP